MRKALMIEIAVVVIAELLLNDAFASGGFSRIQSFLFSAGIVLGVYFFWIMLRPYTTGNW